MYKRSVYELVFFGETTLLDDIVEALVEYEETEKRVHMDQQTAYLQTRVMSWLCRTSALR